MEAAAATFARTDGLSARIRTGDRDVFVSLYGPDFDGLFDFVLRSVLDRESATVALSDSLHRAWEVFCERGHLTTFEVGSSSLRAMRSCGGRGGALGMCRSARDSSTRLSRLGGSPIRR